MIDGRRALGLIPARGGSKGLPGKHLRALGGRPLIAWTIAAARASRHLDRVVVSTDDEAIAQAARDCGAEVPFRRAAALASDTAATIDVALDAVDRLPGHQLLVLLQPTSPLRTAADIDGALEALVRQRATSCVSVTEPDKSPYWSYSLGPDRRLRPLFPPREAASRRQALPPTVVLNGAIYVADCAWLRRGRRFVDDATIAWLMPKERSVDIDTALDLKIAQCLAEGVE